MKRVVLLLVLANVLMFVWNRGWFDGVRTSSPVAGAEHADRLQPVPLSRLEAPPVRPAPAHASGRASEPAPERASESAPESAPESASESASASASAPAPEPAPASEPEPEPAPAPAPAPSAALPSSTPDVSRGATGEAAAAAAALAFCRAFAPVDETRAQALRDALEQAGARVDARRIEQGASYLVHLPPASSRAEAQQRLVEVRRVGRDDAFVIQDGPLRLAISLGLFRFESAARTMVEQLARAGESRALVTPRPPIQVTIALQARWPGAEGEALATMLGAQFDAEPVRDCD